MLDLQKPKPAEEPVVESIQGSYCFPSSILTIVALFEFNPTVPDHPVTPRKTPSEKKLHIVPV